MRDRAKRLLVLSIALMGSGPTAAAIGQEKAAERPRARKVLVELYTSQGCDSCPSASDLLGQLGAIGYGPDRVVPINFHVDYFNTPWVDPYSDAAYSRRQLSYNQVKRRDDLYFTPLMMVDGRSPLLGSDRPKALAALREASRAPAAVAIDPSLEGAGPRKVLSVKLAARSPAAVGRDLFVGVALTEDRVTTRVLSGENAGKSLVEHDVARRLDHAFARLDKASPKTLTFPVELPAGSDPSHFRIVVFVQDRANGEVHQAEAIPWAPATKATGPSPERSRDLGRTLDLRRARRSASLEALAGFEALMTSGFGSQGASTGPFDPATPIPCPACGAPFIPRVAPPVVLRPGESVAPLPTMTC